MSNIEYRVIKNKKVDKETNLKVLKNVALSRLSVEFSSDVCKLVVQKTFQDTHDGRTAAEEFQKSIKSTNDLKKYFGVK